MIICIGGEEFGLEEPISQVEFDIRKLEAIIEGLIQYKELKKSTLEWLANIHDSQKMS